MALNRTLDTIHLRNLHTTCCIGPDAWSRPGKQQPLILTLNLQIDTTAAGVYDDIDNTFSYGTMCKDILSGVERGHFANITRLTSHMAQIAEDWPGERLRIVALAPKALLRVEGGLGKELLLEKEEILGGWCLSGWEWVIKGLKVACIIGVNPHERLEKQAVVIELRVSSSEEEEEPSEKLACDGAWRGLVRGVCEVCHSQFPFLAGMLSEKVAAMRATCLRHHALWELLQLPAYPRICFRELYCLMVWGSYPSDCHFFNS